MAGKRIGDPVGDSVTHNSVSVIYNLPSIVYVTISADPYKIQTAKN